MLSRAFSLALLLAVLAVAMVSAVQLDAQTQAALEEHAAQSMRFFEARRAALAAEAEANVKATGASVESNAALAGTQGLDYSTLASPTVNSCFYKSGYRFVIPRAYRSSGSVDPSIIANLQNAAAAGIKYRDGYIFPCVQCSKTALMQLQELRIALLAKSQSIGMIWLDYETHNWYTDKKKNEAFAVELLNAALNVGFKVGVYTNKVMWETLFTKGFKLPATYPLWYAHYDNKPNYSDWVAFANWSTPAMKQFKGDVSVCNLGVDVNVY